MSSLLRRFLSSLGGAEKPPRPVIRRQEDELPLELRFRMQPNRIYRKFPFDSDKQISANCQFCGAQIHGETQENCLHCQQAILPRMVDVTDEPNHLTKPADPDQPQVVSADALIPTFGGDNVELGDKSVAVSAIGNKVVVKFNSTVERIAGNEVHLEGSCQATVAIAKDKFEAWGSFQCSDGLTAKEIVLGSGSRLSGDVIIPEKGKFYASDLSYFDVIYAGAGTEITIGDYCGINKLVILGPGVKIIAGRKCRIGEIETDSRFQIRTGNNYKNEDQYELQENYDLLRMINELVDQALEL